MTYLFPFSHTVLFPWNFLLCCPHIGRGKLCFTFLSSEYLHKISIFGISLHWFLFVLHRSSIIWLFSVSHVFLLHNNNIIINNIIVFPPTSVLLCAIMSSVVLGNQLLSSKQAGSQAWGGSACCSPTPQTRQEARAKVDMKDLSLRVRGLLSVGELIRKGAQGFLKCRWACPKVEGRDSGI